MNSSSAEKALGSTGRLTHGHLGPSFAIDHEFSR